MSAFWPCISPDGTKVVFTATGAPESRGLEVNVIGIDGGTPQKIVDMRSVNGGWSPDGNLVLVKTWNGIAAGNNFSWQIFDVRSGKTSPVPSSQGMVGASWVTQDVLVAANESLSKLLTFDFRTQKWSDLLAGNFVSWAVLPDGKYLYVTTGGGEPKAQRVRLADRRTEDITSLKNLRRVVDWMGGQTHINVGPDGSPVFTRDIGTQEIYAVTVKWP
jgi:hypothetical protein